MTTVTTSRRPRRPGFTLVELMVSAAVCVIIMTILAVAFQSGIDTMRTLKSVGDLQDQLRAARGTMERDLGAAHFAPGSSTLSGPRLADQRVDDSNYFAAANRPAGGFFRLQGNSSNAPPVQDSDTLEFDNSPTPQIDHLLHFTSFLPVVIKPGEKDPDPTQWYRAQINSGANANTKFSPVAELAYFLDKTSTASTPPTASSTGVPLYKLVRRQRLVAQSAVLAPDLQPPNIEQNTGFDRAVVALKPDASGPNAGKYNTACTAADLVELSSGNRLGGTTVNRTNGDENLGAITDTVGGTGTGRNQIGDDILLTNVLLFEVRASWTPGSGAQGPRPFKPLSTTPTAPNNTFAPDNTHSPFDVIGWAKTSHQAQVTPPIPNPAYNPTPDVFFDTGGNPADSKFANVRISSLQITIRIFDPNTNTARQTTIRCNP